MSACSGSDRAVRRVLRAARPARAAALLLALLLVGLPGLGLARTRPAAPPDTGAVTHVRVSGEGVEVTRGARTVTVGGAGESRTHGRVQIGPRGVIIDADVPDSGASSVEVNVPGVHVHAPAVIVDGQSSDLVRVFADVHVPPGTTVDGDVVAVCGSATIEGHVNGSVVAVCGSVHLMPGAAVEEDAVAVGGALEQAPGATVKGQTVSVGFLPLGFGPPTLAVMLLTIMSGWLLTLFMAWLLSLLFGTRMVRIATTASRQGGSSVLVGLLSAPLVVVGLLLLCVTVIGIPVAVLLPIAYALVVWTGQLAATYLLGCKLLGRRSGDIAVLGPIAAGATFVALFFIAGAVLSGPPGLARTFALFFSLMGVLLVCGLSILGTGALLLSRFGSAPRDAGSAPLGAVAPPPVPPVPPVPPTPLAPLPPEAGA